MRRALLACLAVYTLVAPVRADADKNDAQRTHDITVDDYFTQADIGECVISPDGKLVAYTLARWQESTDDRKADIYVVDTALGKTTGLTVERTGDHGLHWSPDGRWIYFLGSRKREADKQPPYDGKTQVWRISPDGGAPAPVTQVEGGVGGFDLTRDGRTLYYTTEKDVVGEEWKPLWNAFKDLQYGHGVEKRHIVWRLEFDAGRAEKIVDDDRVVRELAVSPDGSRLAMITTPDESTVSFEGKSRVDIYHRFTAKVTPLPDAAYRADAPSPYGWLERLAWSPDSLYLAFSVIFDAYPAEILVAQFGKGDYQSKPRVLARPEGLSVRGYGSPLQWRRSRDLCFLGEEKGRVRLCAFCGVGNGHYSGFRTLTPGDVVVNTLSFDNAGETAALILNDAAHLPDIHVFRGDGPPTPLTHVNPQADTWKLPQMRIEHWTGADGLPVEGILELSPDYKEGQRVPLVVAIHGGPTTADYLQLQFWIYGRVLLPAKGYAVLCPNYRGSTGYGDRFLTDLVGRENDVDVTDILRGVDAMVERGIADPDRLAVSGWSNGGYLTNCCIAKSTRFKAASTGAGIVDTVMEWGANDEPAYPIALKKGLPWQVPDNYRRTSPTYELEKIKTPTLIHVGGNDERCPPGHSRMLYRALKEYLNVPTELVVYPGEPHGLTKYKHRKAKMEWDLAWFEKYVKGK